MDPRELDLRRHDLTVVIADALVKVAPAHVLKYEDINSCIIGTRYALEVFGHYGVKALPFPTTTFALNEPAMRWVTENGRIPRGGDPSYPDAHRGGDAMIRAAGATAQPDSAEVWHGHLIAIADDVMVDLTCDQFSDPRYGLAPLPCMTVVPRGFVEAREEILARVDPPGEGYLLYVPAPANQRFLEAPAFQPPNRFQWRDILDPVIAEIDAMDHRTVVGSLCGAH